MRLDRKFEPSPRTLTAALRIAPRRHSSPGKYWMASQRVNSPVPSSSAAGTTDSVSGTSASDCWRLDAVVTSAWACTR